MSELQKCPQCGAELSPGSPQGLCPQCLLKAGLATASGVQVEPALTVPESLADFEQPTAAVDPDSESLSMASPETKIRYFGDYEILEEIARGGMGVVYKARQTSLNRTVALKMILSGQLASESDVQRFDTEAEAAANLQHPNIVNIHEVGKHEGQHYFSMDYVEGRSLADLTREHPLDAHRAASYVKSIAEAIDYAHGEGTLHRDLKPANVLIDSSDRVRITDFGLAKRIDGEAELTATGQVLGTPAYMPPEQASGRHADLGPRSDLYSIGAILYELLTGRPPFQAETPLQTLIQVCNSEPAAPRSLNPSIPRDLENICLKCLEKLPGRRYGAARELQEDLERFLNREPVRCQPVSRWRRAAHWAGRHPWIIVAGSSCLILGLSCLVYWLWTHNRYLMWVSSHPGHTHEEIRDHLALFSHPGTVIGLPLFFGLFCVWPSHLFYLSRSAGLPVWQLIKLTGLISAYHRLGRNPVSRGCRVTCTLTAVLGGLLGVLMALGRVEESVLQWHPERDVVGAGLSFIVIMLAVQSLWTIAKDHRSELYGSAVEKKKKVSYRLAPGTSRKSFYGILALTCAALFAFPFFESTNSGMFFGMFLVGWLLSFVLGLTASTKDGRLTGRTYNLSILGSLLGFVFFALGWYQGGSESIVWGSAWCLSWCLSWLLGSGAGLAVHIKAVKVPD